MFKKTQNRLVILNVIVFMVLLYGLGSALYFSMQYNLYSQVDRELQRAVFQMNQGPALQGPMPSAPLSHLKLERKRFGDVDRRIVFLFWGPHDQFLAKAFGEMIENDDIPKFKPEGNELGITTKVIDGQPYRICTIMANRIIFTEGQLQKVEKVQLVYNLEPEQKMLDLLLYVLGIGGFVSIIIAIVTGRFLAKRALVPIQQSWEKQQQFIADASHELRTPLSVIRLNLERLFRNPDHTIEEESETISASMQETKRLTKLVTDLLTLARSDSNELQILKQRVRLDEIVLKSIRTFSQLAELKEITMKRDVEEPLEIMGDEERLQQLMVILLDNALKYTQETGQITVSCKREGNWITIIVSDTGIGISQEELGYVFDRFFRGDKMRSRAEEGTGLGLSIAKWIVEAHDGKIRVESKEGAGTSFTITLPAKS
ncbi:sensor histidine kinase [Brevibacillus fluminis]|uniref:histidine kinase n=1 Tax=Brevibacillus fluminis TaxID=511487 RepID=A0A3M8DG15_9BACL|nr:HAMP domain-containing sensor histidine kinase [Brevibacillus fluminis]RNB87042.1 sensor histidine kinase [Brevibacillus fluminis]